MAIEIPQTYSAFAGPELYAAGPLEDVLLKVKRLCEKTPDASILVFSDSTGRQMDFDLSGTVSEVRHRLRVFLPIRETTVTGPGRPRLGVVAREVSLLPRHWEWLATQPGGASATLRRLVEDAGKKTSDKNLVKQIQERTYRFMSVLAGDLPGYEEALRALYRGEEKNFKNRVAKWPRDIRKHALKLAQPGWRPSND